MNERRGGGQCRQGLRDSEWTETSKIIFSSFEGNEIQKSTHPIFRQSVQTMLKCVWIKDSVRYD